MKKLLLLGACLLLSLTACSTKQATTKSTATSSHTATSASTRQDSPAKTSLPTVDNATVKQALADWSAKYVVNVNNASYVRTSDGASPVTTFSEATGYALLLGVTATAHHVDNGTMFARFFRYYQQHQSKTAAPLMAWRQTQRNGQMTSDDSEQNNATDADLDIAYALIQQAKLTGNSQYRQAAKALITALKTKAFNAETALPKLGNWATASDNRDIVRTSDLIPYYFTALAQFTGDTFWQRAEHNAVKVLTNSSDAKTGLLPDFIVVQGDRDMTISDIAAGKVEGASDPTYGYNACRIPWRLANDYAITHRAASRTILTRLLTFMVAQPTVYAGYTVGGHATQTYTDPAFTTPLAYAETVLGDAQAAKRFKASGLLGNKYYADTLATLTTVAAH